MKTKVLIVVLILIISSLSAIVIYNLINSGPENVPDENPDFDGDGLLNALEAEVGTNPREIDTDNDGLDDKEEYDYWTYKFENTSEPRDKPIGDWDADGKVNIIDEDSDNDGLFDGYELGIETDPAKSDTDNDNIDDKDEILEGLDPKNPDTDGDGVIDGSDINPKVDLSVGIKLTKFQVKQKVDLLKWAQVYFDIIIDDETVERLDNRGGRWWVLLNEIKNINHDEIIYDIPDSTDEKFTTIKIAMYDYDLIGSDDIIDLSEFGGEKELVIVLDHKTNTLTGDEQKEGYGGTVWYEVTLAEQEVPEIDYYQIDYNWMFNNKRWETTLDIPVKTYLQYVNNDVSRTPQNQPYSTEKMADFVTSSDEVIVELKDDLQSLAQNFNQVDTVNFVLKFVQTNVKYTLDNESKGCIEYWRFPVETLVEKEGDCEDSSVLLAAILDSMGYDVVLLFYSWWDKGQMLGHLAVGVNIAGDHGDYVEYNGFKYYYCETTNSGYNVGELPPDFDYEPKQIIEI